MKTFEKGKGYKKISGYDDKCHWVWIVLKRTAKYVTYRTDEGQIVREAIKKDWNGDECSRSIYATDAA